MAQPAMKRFWKEAAALPVEDGFRVELDGRPIRTQGGAAQIVPTLALAQAMAAEWNAQDGEIDIRAFPLRDLADFAIDHVAPAPAATVDRLLRYAETDTLCYRADPEEPLFRRQLDIWEPLLNALEARLGIRLERISGIMHRPQSAATLAALRSDLARHDAFVLSALNGLAPLAASLTIALAAVEPGADAGALFAAANAEEDWQAEQWGWEWTAEENREIRLAAFSIMVRFAALARG